MKKIIAGVLLAACLAFGREAIFGDMLDAIVYLGNGYLEVKNNQGRTIKLPSHLYGYKIMFEGLIDRDKSKQCISYKSLPQAQKARLALWKWSDTIEGRSTYPYQDDRQKQIEREAILLNDIATGTDKYKECQKVVIAKAGEMIDRLFSLFQSYNKPQATTASYQPQATTTYDVGYWIQKITKARDIAKNTKEYKECQAVMEEFSNWETRRLYLERFEVEYEQRDPLSYYEDVYRDIFDSDRIVLSLEQVEAQNKKLKVTSNDIIGEIWEQIYKIQENLEKSFFQKLKAYEASKEYKVWRALEKQTLKYAYKNLESSSEWQTVLVALKQASLTKEYQEMTKAQNAVRATQAFKETKKEAESRIYRCDREGCGPYQWSREGVRDSKEFKVWKAADKAYKATKEYKAAESLAQSQREKLRNEFRAIELVKKEIKEGIKYIAESIKKDFMVIPRPCGLATSLSMACLYGYYLIPKNWEDDLWYGKETTYDELGRIEDEGFEIEYYWEY
ncbi:hypothetical protein [Helicobacter sp. MIT 01-3238]|uniref:hypothetical protein n=1 Tax=Helicobacter sp. MIT 01-3238 TaxID=398627 RepID=UPI000E1E61CD|nr:hypothetical protein [Helicobacter sp. MIT 01-3238]RDU52230.1 hypothetical protein CQA40_07775 [Helicobacter sp. MIT 01-3238]